MTEREEIEMARKEGYRAGYQCGYIDGEVHEAKTQEKIRMLNDPARQKEMATIRAEEERKKREGEEREHYDLV